ncbi:hypothetical protein N8823_04925 [Candidatus Pseudothioglobus singularis]|jgi:hypothetical protein|nr:hypothetical protein [Candidatus Pseudothioglobus singularis]
MRIFLFISLALISQFVFASFDVSNYSDDQICTFAKDPPLPSKITFEIEARDIICDEGVAFNKSETPFTQDSKRFMRLKRWNKMLRGKRPIYSTRSGTNIKIKTFGSEKSITVDRVF